MDLELLQDLARPGREAAVAVDRLVAVQDAHDFRAVHDGQQHGLAVPELGQRGAASELLLLFLAGGDEHGAASERLVDQNLRVAQPTRERLGPQAPIGDVLPARRRGLGEEAAVGLHEVEPQTEHLHVEVRVRRRRGQVPDLREQVLVGGGVEGLGTAVVRLLAAGGGRGAGPEFAPQPVVVLFEELAALVRPEAEGLFLRQARRDTVEDVAGLAVPALGFLVALLEVVGLAQGVEDLEMQAHIGHRARDLERAVEVLAPLAGDAGLGEAVHEAFDLERAGLEQRRAQLIGAGLGLARRLQRLVEKLAVVVGVGEVEPRIGFLVLHAQAGEQVARLLQVLGGLVPLPV